MKSILTSYFELIECWIEKNEELANQIGITTKFEGFVLDTFLTSHLLSSNLLYKGDVFASQPYPGGKVEIICYNTLVSLFDDLDLGKYFPDKGLLLERIFKGLFDFLDPFSWHDDSHFLDCLNTRDRIEVLTSEGNHIGEIVSGDEWYDNILTDENILISYNDVLGWRKVYVGS